MFRAPSDLERSMLSPVPSSPTAMPLTMPLEFEPSVSEHQPTSNPAKANDSVPEGSSQALTDTLKPTSLSKKQPTHAKSAVMTSGAFATAPSSTDTQPGGLGRFLGYLNPFSSIGSAVDLTDETESKPSSSEPPAPTVSTIVDTHIATLTRLSPRVSSIPNLQEEEMARIQEWTYAHFTAKMKGTEHTRILKAFVRDIQGLPNLSLGYCSEIHRFADRLLQTLMADAKWAGASHDELLNASEGIEKFIFSKVHDRLFSQLSPGFRKYMGKIDKLVFSLQWVQPEHLDIPTPYWNDKVFAMAAEELKKMSVYKAPKDKVTCLLNCCQVVMNWMKVVHVQDHERREKERREREEVQSRGQEHESGKEESGAGVVAGGEAKVEGENAQKQVVEGRHVGKHMERQGGGGPERKAGEEEEEDQFYDLDGDEERSTHTHAQASVPEATAAAASSEDANAAATGAGACAGEEQEKARKEKQEQSTTLTATTAPAKRSRSLGIGNGADNFLPIFVLVLFRAQPQHLAFHVECIAQGRHPERLKGLQDYYFTHLKSVLAFVEQVDARMLSVERDVYEREMARWGQEWEARYGEGAGGAGEGAATEEEKAKDGGESPQDVPVAALPDGQIAGRQDVPIVKEKEGNVVSTTNTTVVGAGSFDAKADADVATHAGTLASTYASPSPCASATTTTTTADAPAPHSRALALALPPSSPFPPCPSSPLSAPSPGSATTTTTASTATSVITAATSTPTPTSTSTSTSVPASALAATASVDSVAPSSTATAAITAAPPTRASSACPPTLSPSLVLALSSLLHTHPSTHPLSLDTITLAQLPALLQELEVLREAVVLVQSAVYADEELAQAVKGANGSGQ